MSQGAFDRPVGRQGGILALEIGELAAWVALTYGRDLNGQRRWRMQFTAPPSLNELVERIQAGVREVADGAVERIGIASWASPLGAGARYLPASDEGSALVAALHSLYDAPVVMRRAVDAAAVSELCLDVRTTDSPSVYIHLGREVLCALAWNGEVAPGAHGLSGQIGHWRVSEDGPRCACGQTGHLNPLCSSQGFVRLAIGLAAQDDAALAAASAASGARVEALTAQRIVALALDGVAPLAGLVERSADALGVALARLTLLVDPARVILGGPLGVAGLGFIEQARARMSADLRAVSTDWRPPEIAPARFEPNSALVGAWLLASERAIERAMKTDG